MKKIVYYLSMLTTVFVLAGCTGGSDDDDWNPGNNTNTGSNIGTSGSTTTSAAGSLKDLLNLDVSINTESLSESDDVPKNATDTYYDDYVENNFSAQNTVTITYNGISASYDQELDGDTITVSGGDVTVKAHNKGTVFKLTGATTNGSFKIYSEKKFQLTLSDVSIAKSSGAAINIQDGNCFVVLEGTNTLADSGSSYNTADGEDEKGVFFSEDKLRFSGKGSLTVNSKVKHGIVSDDYLFFRPQTNIYVKSTSGHCFKSNDGIFILGGVLNAETSATASKGFKTDGRFEVSGGRTTAITSGGGEYDSDDKDVSAAAGVKADSAITISGGELYVKSTGKGGKGISTDMTFTITGGTVHAVTSGGTYKYSSSLDSKGKGIKADGNMYIKGGEIMVKALGGEGSEGIETKGTYTQDAGSVAAYSYDDGINSAKTMTINGGYLYGYGTNNDGIDSNGNLTINGGTVIGCGASSPEEGIDAAEGYTFAINGGTVIGIGGGGESMSGSQQKMSVSGVSISSGYYLTIGNGTTTYFALQVPCAYSNATVQVSSPKFSSGTAYTMGYASAASGSDDFYGFVTSPTLSGTTGTYSSSLTTSTSTTGGMGGNMGGGNRPGGRW